MNFNIVIRIFINKGMLALVVTTLLSCLFKLKEFGWESLGFVIWGVLVLWELIGVWVGRNLRFVIWGFGVVEVGRERLNLGIVFVGGILKMMRNRGSGVV